MALMMSKKKSGTAMAKYSYSYDNYNALKNTGYYTKGTAFSMPMTTYGSGAVEVSECSNCSFTTTGAGNFVVGGIKKDGSVAYIDSNGGSGTMTFNVTDYSIIFYNTSNNNAMGISITLT